jgi:hypothetical protein
LDQAEADVTAQQQQPVADAIAPSTTAALSAPPNAAGWHNHDVTVNLSATDNPGGSGVKQITYSASGAQPIAPTNANGDSASITINTEGTTMINFFATDNAGNIEPAHSLTIKLDKTPPTIQATRTPGPNNHGWNRTSVTVHFACSDNLSGPALANLPADVLLTSEGAGQSATGTCYDDADNPASLTVRDINIDETPPYITGRRTPGPNGNGWNNTDVAVIFECSDALSTIDTCGPSPEVITTEGAGQLRTGTAVDLAGNTATATVDNINIDKTPPVMVCGAAPNLLWPPDHKLVNVTTDVTLTDSLSGGAGFVLLSAASNEPDNGLGDGDTPNDVQGFVAGTASTRGQLRSERSGRGAGRVYLLNYQGKDRAGNTAACATAVTVPHDQGKR